MKFLYYLACIGNPNLETKLKILDSNIEKIYSNIKVNFDLVLNIYSDFQTIRNHLVKYSCIDNILIYEKPGVLTELWLTNPSNDLIVNYDYILFILDDVEIINFDFDSMVKFKNENELQILSPYVYNSTQTRWFDSKRSTLNNMLEVFCLLLTPPDFKLFCSIHTIENKWMWGVDYTFGYRNINTGVYIGSSVKHHFRALKHNELAMLLAKDYLEKMGLNEKYLLNKFNPIKKYFN